MMENSRSGRKMVIPSGTVTFLFTDIESSTKLLQQLGAERYGRVLSDQRVILRAAFDEFNGMEIDTQGDSFFVSFSLASEAVAAVVQIQQTLAEHEWPEGGEVRLRMGLHTGEPWQMEDGYVGIDVHRAARITHVGHGGQVLLSASIAGLIADDLPPNVSLRDLGEFHLKDLRTPKRIYQLDIDGLQTDFPSLSGGRPNNLPTQTTSFVGRRDELAAIDRLIAEPDVRLITILGPGGIGKTRIALAAAERQLDSTDTLDGHLSLRFPQGVFIISLIALSSANQIVPAVAEALNFQMESRDNLSYPHTDQRAAKEQLLDYLRDKRLLLVFDNFEHLLEGTRLVIDILNNATGVQILVTSRECLGLQSEQLFNLGGMTFPDYSDDISESFSAMSLFEHRARLVWPDFTIQVGEREIVGEICRIVGGMPLAIELAAAWVDVLSLEDIVAEIRHGLGILETESGDIAERHHSVNSIFESTYKTLDKDERDGFCKLTVFRGGFSRQAAEEISGTNLLTLRRLVQKSLLKYNPAKYRFEIHELLRQFGAEKLAYDSEVNHIRTTHSNFYCKLLADQDQPLKGKKQYEAILEIEAEIKNILTAWKWAVRQKMYNELDAGVGALDQYFYQLGHDDEWRHILGQTVEHLDGIVIGEGHRVLVKMRIYLAATFPWKERNDAMVIAQSCIKELEKPDLKALDVRFEKAKIFEIMSFNSENPDQILNFAELALAQYHEIGDLWNAARVLSSLGAHARTNSRFSESKIINEECLAMRREIGDLKGIAQTLALLATSEITLGNYEEAVRLARESLLTNQSINNVRDLHTSHYALGWGLTFLGRNIEARQTIKEDIEVLESLGLSEPSSYNLLGLIELDLGLYKDAEIHGIKGLKIAKAKDSKYAGGIGRYLLGRIKLVKKDYEAAELLLEKALEVFGNKTLGGDTQANLASLHYFVGDNHEALRRYRIALENILEFRFSFAGYRILPAIALIFADLGSLEYAIELQGLAENAPHVINSQWIYDLFGGRLETASKNLSTDAVANAKIRGQTNDLWVTLEKLHADFKIPNAFEH